ncbi:multidrug resistance-associated protein 5, partial [Tanacetum coccineum]
MLKADRNEEQNQNSIESSDDDYNSSDCEEIENVDFQTEGDESVVIKDISTSDPFLNKLCSARIMFRGKSGVTLSAFRPDIPWIRCTSTTDEVYETPQQNVEEGRCAGKKGNKDRVMPNKVRSGVKKKVIKKQIVKKKKIYNLGALLLYRWIASGKYFKRIIEDPFILATCRLDVDESANGSATFRRIYICFKGVKDGWLAGCRKAVVRVENADNWGWFLHLLHDDLSFIDGNRITIISDSHKGLIDAVNDWLPEAGHIKCTRHIYANFKKKYSGLQYQILFWAATSCTLEQQFMQIMDQIKQIDEGAYDYLIQRNLNSWSRAFFDMDRRCAAFENGISKSFNRAILGPRQKHIITMLEEIRLYIMQRLVAMNKLAFNLEDRITPSVRKRLEILKEKQRMWELSGVPCVHDVAAYLHCGIDLYLGKMTNDVPPLPPLVRRLPGKPQKAKIKAPYKSSGSHTSRVGRTMTCTNYWQKGHNRASCTADPTPKPTVEKKQPGRKRQAVVGHCTSRGRGRGRSGIRNEASGSGMGGIGEASVGRRRGSGGRGTRGGGMGSSGGRRGGGRGSKGVGSTRGGGMAGSSSIGILTSEEERREEREWEEKQDYFNPDNFREDSIEEAPFYQAYAEVFILSIHCQPTQQSGVWVKDTTDVTTKNIDEAPATETSETIDVSAMVKDLSAPAMDKGKGKESVEDQASAPKKKRGRPPSHVDGIRIYHKNRGRSERIANIKEKKAFQFDMHETG